MSRQLDCVDADGHVLEPPKFWAEYIDPVWREKAPEVFLDAEGVSLLRVEDQVIPGADPVRGLANAGGIGIREGAPPPWIYEEGRKGGFDPDARIADLDLDGIDAVYLYPTVGLIVAGNTKTPELAAASCRAYNRWLADFCSVHPDRLFGAAMLPMQSVELAVEELRFAAENLGYRAAFIRPNAFNSRRLDDPAFDPLWQIAQDFDMAMGFHEGAGGMPALADGRVDGVSADHMTSHTVEMMLASLHVIWGGVCERFPRLRFAFLESGGGWIAGWLDRMDRHFDDRHMRGDGPPGRPSEYFQRQCWISFEPVEGSLPYLAEYLGPEKILWATDYPHRDGFFPGAPKMIADKLPESIRRAVLAGGAIAYYKL